MNARARNRLIGISVILLVVAVAVLAGSGALTGSYSTTVSGALKGESAGKRVKVTGSVVPGSWDKKTNPMTFKIRDEGKTSGPELAVVYKGAPPNTFGNDTVAIVTGSIAKDGSLQADDMITKCPSKYQTKSGALTVSQLLKSKATLAGKPTKVAGQIKAGSLKAGGDPRFALTGDGADVLLVSFEGAMPQGSDKNGVSLVVGGELEADGTFTATSVAVAK
jgi:cytochrome c-type biogenesis protein CcmE